jgi:uncharacterized repeat protein (TIGR04076 family)
MAKLKVTVVKCFTQEEIFGDEVPDHLKGRISPCQRHHPGQQFIMDSLNCPEGFCNWAYDDIYRDMAHLWMDGDFPFIGKPGTMFSSCTDGKKPVVFKLERIEG